MTLLIFLLNFIVDEKSSEKSAVNRANSCNRFFLGFCSGSSKLDKSEDGWNDDRCGG